MTTADDRTPGFGTDTDPLAVLGNGLTMLTVAAAAQAVITRMVQLPEPAWLEEVEAAAAGAAITYPPGYVPVPDDQLGNEVGHLDGAAVLRLAQLHRAEPEDEVLTVLEHDNASATGVTVIGGEHRIPADANGFDATIAALTASGWSVRAYETFHTRVRGIFHAEAARRHADPGSPAGRAAN